METIKRILARVFKLFLASSAAMLLGSVFSSQRVIEALGDIGGKVQFSDRLSMTLYDAMHFGSLYWVFIFLAFAIAFVAAWGVYKITNFGRLLIYIIASVIAMFVMLWAMEQVFFGVPIVAGARDGFGLILQMFAGGVGGFIFARITSPKPTKSI